MWTNLIPSFVAAMLLLLAKRSVHSAQVRLDGRTFTLPDGFTIEKVAGPPLVNRPIAADFDELGRLYVDDSSGTSEDVTRQLVEKPHRVVRLEDTTGAGRFDRSIVFGDRMMFPEGAMWYGGSLYVAAPPGIWKLTDTTGRGVADQRSEWFQGKTLTHCANDLHGPYPGPDGWIYWCKGAFAEQTYERPGRKPFVTRAAHIFRCRPDGSGIEPVMTGGMDNPVHVVFTPGGERIFTTTFLQQPAGGRRDGIIHAVYGGIYGKVHDVIDDHPHTSPDVMPVMVHLGPAAACGLCRYESDLFGAEYRDNLFATCFNLRKVTRHVLTPDGATFKATNEDFLVCDDLDFHPTDVIEDADGSLLVIDTGGWYKICCPTSQLDKPDVLGAIYRVRRAGMPRLEDPRGLKLAWKTMNPRELAALLDDRRPAVRKRAIQALADKRRDAFDALYQVLHGSKSPLARLNAVWAATRIDDVGARELVRGALEDPDETVRQAAGHSASIWRDRKALPALVRLLGSDSAHNRRVAAEALGRIGDSSIVPSLLQAIARSNDRVLDHSLTYALIEIGNPIATQSELSSANPRVRRSAMMALDQMEVPQSVRGSVAQDLLSDDRALRETATWIAERHPEDGDFYAKCLGHQLDPEAVSADSIGPLQHLLAKLSRSPSIQSILVSRAEDPKASAQSRQIALAAMAESGLKDPPAAWLRAISDALNDGNQSVVAGAVSALSKFRLGKGNDPAKSSQLLHVAARVDLPAETRLDALNAIPGGVPAISPELFTFLMSQLDARNPASQRLSAAQAISRARLSTRQLSELTDAIKTAGPLEIDPLLAAFSQTSDESVGEKLVAALKNAKALTSLRADAVQSRLSKFGLAVKQQGEALVSRLNPDRAAQQARLDQLLATLPPGDIRRGEALFNGSKVACSTCHAIGYVGGNVGPDLTRVGAIRARRDLLESIVLPSASFVQSFEPVMVITTSGDRQYGIPRRNDAQEVMLITGPNQQVHIPRNEVKEIRPGTVSVMPAGFGDQLSLQELGDLLAFLQACR